jgi:signal transduction histidine kinase
MATRAPDSRSRRRPGIAERRGATRRRGGWGQSQVVWLRPLEARDEETIVMALQSQVSIRPARCDAEPATASAEGLTAAEFAELRHEVGNALTSAAGYAQFLARRMPAWAAESDRRALEAIRDAVARAHRLLSSDRAGDPGRNLARLFHDALSQVPPERAVDVSVRWLTDEPLSGPWDGAAIMQVLANLLQNAAKYSAGGTPIAVEFSSEDGWARVAVRDAGIGVHPDDLDAIFTGYRTEQARRTAPGHGIGLRLSRRLIERAGGRLWATSTPGVGSTFVAELPLRSSDDELSAVPPSNRG